MKLDRLIQLAIFEANKSNYKQKLGAVIFDRKSIISTAYNIVGSKRRNLHPKRIKWENSLHAEALSIINAKKDLRGKSLLVVRVNNSDELRCSMPCKNCLDYCEYVMLKEVYFINKNLELERVKL